MECQFYISYDIEGKKKLKEGFFMSEDVKKDKVSPEETGRVLYYLVGSKADEFLGDKETLEKIGLGEVDRDDFYIEMTILNMFLMVNQYTHWEKEESAYNKALDQMHFLLFHQLKEYSNYDEDDVEQLHQHIFRRYDEYGNAIEANFDSSWLKTLAEDFINKLTDELEDNQAAINVLGKYIEKFYKSIPNILNTL